MDADTLSLGFVPAERVILHEGVEPRRVSELMQLLRSDGVLRNPPVVAPIGQRWVVLDGATRVTALQRIGTPHLLVQTVDPQHPGLEVRTWHHLVTGVRPDELRDQLAHIPGVRLQEHAAQLEAQMHLDEKRLLCYLVLQHTPVLALEGGEDLHSQVLLLHQVVDAYRARTRIHRVVTTELETLLKQHENVTAVVVFPRYGLDEILALAGDEVKLPTGITRFVIPGRVLRMDIPLDTLTSAQPLEEKNRWLERFIMDKLAQKKIRYYQEPVFLFDD